MDFVEDFPKGCRVECTDHPIHRGAVGTVVGHGFDTLRVEFDKASHPNPILAFRYKDVRYHSLFPQRFIRMDGQTVTPIIRKIRQMEQRRKAA